MEHQFPPPYDRIYQEEIALLTGARAALARLDIVSVEDLKRVEDMLEHLNQLFLLVVVGEFNSGKSTFINALLQDNYLPVGILPTTARITIVRHGQLKGSRNEDSMVVLTHPAPVLQKMSIVDTPGTNAVFRQHEKLAHEFVHRSDFVFFVMAATHAFAETDRVYLELVRQYGPKVVIILNQIDLLAGQKEIQEVERFIGEQCAALLGFRPEVIPVSAKWATESFRLQNLPHRRKLWEDSNMQEVVDLVNNRLNEEVRLREKLSTPLRVIQAVAARYQGALDEQLALLARDFATISEVEAQERAYQQSITSRLDRKLERLEPAFDGMLQRGNRFIDENLQLRALARLLNRQEFQNRFQEAVIADAPATITSQVNQIVDELIAEDRKQWQATFAAIRQMLMRHQDEIIGAVDDEFQVSLEAFEDNVRQAERALMRYSRQDAASSMRDIQLGAIGETIITGVSGLVGGIIMMAVIDDIIRALIAMQAGATISALVGPLGWAVGGAATLGGSAWLISRRLPRARQQAKQALQEQIGQLRHTFEEALSASTAQEFAAFRGQIHQALTPVEGYLTRLRDELQSVQDQLNGVKQEATRLQNAIER